MKPAVMIDGLFPELRLASPAVGEHSADVLREAGFGADEIATLMEARVIA
jgi:crotonobetainyl-CoA:carnitine CoA-transferase CaiB-like acyl-CoA transferase